MPTIVDIARMAGVSRQTVSRALNDLPDVSPATKDRVLTAARTVNYRPNRSAQRLVSGPETVIGLVVGDLRNPYYPELASAMTRLAAERSWGTMVWDLSGDDARRRLETMSGRVDALVGHIPTPTALSALRVPSVVLDGAADDAAHAVVEIDYRSGISAALDHLVSRGRSRIGMIDASAEPSARRLLYREYLRRTGLHWSPASEAWAADTHEGGIRAAFQLASAHRDLDAVLVFNDVMAVGALKGLAAKGIAVPGDIAVIGIDGLDIGTLVSPELTSLRLDKTRLARLALELVDELFSGGAVSVPRHRLIGHSLVVRGSA